MLISVISACNTNNEYINKSDNIENMETYNESMRDDTEKNSVKSPDVIISDENFIADMDKVFNNIDSYVGKTIQLEGFIGSVYGNNFKVLRLYDMNHEDHSHEVTVGVNVVYKDEIPAEDTWVEILGVITKDVIDGREQPVIIVSKLEKKFTHGKLKVYN